MQQYSQILRPKYNNSFYEVLLVTNQNPDEKKKKQAIQ